VTTSAKELSEMKTFQRLVIWICAATFVACAGAAFADEQDPPGRVARLKLVDGQVSVQPAGVEDWAGAVVNRPLTNGDNLWADKEARADLSLGGAHLRLGSETSVTLTNISDDVVQIAVHQGFVNLRVRRLEPGETYEVDTPNLAFLLLKSGSYRFDVDPNADTTTVTVWKGEGEATGDSPAVDIRGRAMAQFTNGRSLQNQMGEAPPPDGFEQWCHVLDEREDRAFEAVRYVSPAMIGSEDLEGNGTWRDDPNYGHIWVPTTVAAGWAPYHYGHWVWVSPWGWTWVDDAPWGFAPFHYGRWVNVGGVWAWTPGPPPPPPGPGVAVVVRPVYAPALVAWVGGLSISVGGGGPVGWFPLGYGEPYVPSYPVSRAYFTNVNVTNTRITNINNYYVNNTTVNNVTINNIHYANQTVAGAVTVVPKEAMTSAQPVGKAAVPVSPQQLKSAKVGPEASVPPTQHSVLGAKAGAPASAPPASALAKPIAAKTPPPPRPVPFAMQQKAMQQNGGRPLPPAEMEKLRASAPPPKNAPPPPVPVKAAGTAPAAKGSTPAAPPKAAAPPPKPAAATPPQPPKPAAATPAKPPTPPAAAKPAPAQPPKAEKPPAPAEKPAASRPAAAAEPKAEPASPAEHKASAPEAPKPPETSGAKPESAAPEAKKAGTPESNKPAGTAPATTPAPHAAPKPPPQKNEPGKEKDKEKEKDHPHG
jgi:hypothetical protein